MLIAGINLRCAILGPCSAVSEFPVDKYFELVVADAGLNINAIAFYVDQIHQSTKIAPRICKTALYLVAVKVSRHPISSAHRSPSRSSLWLGKRVILRPYWWTMPTLRSDWLTGLNVVVTSQHLKRSNSRVHGYILNDWGWYYTAVCAIVAPSLITVHCACPLCTPLCNDNPLSARAHRSQCVIANGIPYIAVMPLRLLRAASLQSV